MHKTEYSVLAPPRTSSILQTVAAEHLFTLMVLASLRLEKRREGVAHPALLPTFIKVVPFANVDNHVKYAVESGVQLEPNGLTQVRYHTFEAVPRDDNKLGMKNSETDDLLNYDLGTLRIYIAMASSVYRLETFTD